MGLGITDSISPIDEVNRREEEIHAPVGQPEGESLAQVVIHYNLERQVVGKDFLLPPVDTDVSDLQSLSYGSGSCISADSNVPQDQVRVFVGDNKHFRRVA